MAARPEFVTSTRLDARTNFDHAAASSARHPIEWRVLASPKCSGVEPRYPATRALPLLIRYSRILPLGVRLPPVLYEQETGSEPPIEAPLGQAT